MQMNQIWPRTWKAENSALRCFRSLDEAKLSNKNSVYAWKKDNREIRHFVY